MGWIDTKEDADAGGNEKAEENGPEGNSRGEAYDRGDDFGDRDTEEDAKKSAEQSHGCGFNEELEHDILAFGAERLADADFTGALGDRDQHDVHDDHAADYQGDGGNA